MAERKRIYLCLAHMSDEGIEQKYIKEAFDTNWVVPLGPNVNAFEKDLEAFANSIDGSRFKVQGSSPDPQMQQTLQSLQQTVAMLSSTMEALQRNGIYAKINKYGAGGLVDEVADGLYTTKKRGNNTNVRRLFG